MGVVYEVRHPNVPRPLALKLILDRKKGADDKDIKRFEREAQLLAQVDKHPNILKVYQFSQDNGLYFLVTDFIAGGSLAESIPLPPRRAATIARKIADALSHIHTKGILHRDLKPQNVLLRQGEEDEPVLVDFGLAWASEVERLTKTNAMLGTPAYMSPEQLSGGGGAALDGRSDVYALGATLYAALTGDAPFDAPSGPELMGKILMEPPPRPSLKNKDVPPALDAICALALAKSRDARYANAAEMRDDLDRYLRGEGTIAERRVPSATAVKVRRAGLGFLVVVAAIGVAAIALRTAAARVRRNAYAAALTEAEEAARAANGGRRQTDARARAQALDAALDHLEAQTPPPEADAHVRERLRLVADFLAAEVDAQETGATGDRARAFERAAARATAYLEAARSLGFEQKPLEVEPLEDVPAREAALAAALAEGGSEKLVDRLLARPAGDAPSRVVHLDRARASLRLGRARAASTAAEAAQGTDSLGAEARTILARAALTRGDLARARELGEELGKAPGEAGARGRALAAEVELAAGDLDQVEKLVAGTDALPELALLRIELALARRRPAQVAVASAQALLKRTRDPAVAVRVTALLGRAQVLADLETFAPRESPPAFDDAAATLHGVTSLLGHPGASDARAAAAHALLLLAVLEPTSGESLVERAQEIDPLSVEAGFRRFALSRGGAAPARESAASALERLSGELTEPMASVASELAALLRDPKRSAASLAGALEKAASESPVAADRVECGLLATELGRELGSTKPELARSAQTLLASTGAFEAHLVEVGRERVAFEELAEAHGLHSAAFNTIQLPPNAGLGGAPDFERELGVKALRGARARGDAVVALAAADLVLGLSPWLVEPRETRAAAIALIVRPQRGDVTGLFPAARDPVPAVKTLLGSRSAASLAALGLADLEACDPPATDMDRARSKLVRGRLLAAAARFQEAVPEFDEAAAAASRVLGDPSLTGLHEASLAKLAEGQRVRAAAVFERALALEGAGSPDERSRQLALEDVTDRGQRTLETLQSLAEVHRFSDANVTGVLPSEEVSNRLSELRFAVFEKIIRAPLTELAVSECGSTDLDLAVANRAWLTIHRGLVTHGPLGFSYLCWLPHRFYAFLSGENGADAALFTTASCDRAAEEAPPDDAATVLAQANRRIYALPIGPQAAHERAEIALATKQLAEAKRRAPGCGVFYQCRGVLDAAEGELDCARADFARYRELNLDAGHTVGECLVFEACSYGRFGCKEDAKGCLERLLNDPATSWDEVSHIDDTRAFRACRSYPELMALMKQVREKVKPTRR
jgi:hypothetical protein